MKELQDDEYMTQKELENKVTELGIADAFYKKCMNKNAELVDKLDTFDMTDQSDQLEYLLTMKLNNAYVEVLELIIKKYYLNNEKENKK